MDDSSFDIKNAISGVLVVDKPVGLTSHDVVQIVRKGTNIRRAGHTGTLDPLATGVLPLCFGEATKFSQYLLGADKTYLVRARFGARTDTADSDGSVVRTTEFRIRDEETRREGMRHLTGSSVQVRPMYSA